MIYITQLIYLKEGEEESFFEFEDFAIPLMEKYTGKIIHRIRPNQENFVSASQEKLPFEIHIISFETEKDLGDFMNDKTRLDFIHLKEQSVKSMLLIKGVKM